MAVKRKGKGRRRRQAGTSSPASPAPDASSVASLMPADRELEHAGDGAAPAGENTAPPLPPDPGAGEGSSDDRASDASSSDGEPRRKTGHSDPELERQQRCTVLALVFTGVFAALPAHNGGGELSTDEASLLADAWELPLRPYWDQFMGPWAGALLTTVAVIAPRAMAARAKLSAAGVSPGDRVG